MAIALQDMLARGITHAFDYVIEKTNKALYYTIEIDKAQSPKAANAFISEASKYCSADTKTMVARDGPSPLIELALGTYSCNTKEGLVWITIGKQKIKLQTLSATKDRSKFINWFNEVYKAHNQERNVLISYNSLLDKWGMPISRRQKPFNETNLTPTMTNLLKDVDSFIDSINLLEDEEIAYAAGTGDAPPSRPDHRGYYLYGPPGTGKSFMPELVAIRYGLPMYMFNFNSGSMNDAVMITMLASVPPRSVIVFDEIEDQLRTLERNSRASVSVGGMLTAIDGPPRLAFGILIFFTANSDEISFGKATVPLFREGRIDVKAELTEPFGYQVSGAKQSYIFESVKTPKIVDLGKEETESLLDK